PDGFLVDGRTEFSCNLSRPTNFMNPPTNQDQITVHFSGQISISPEKLKLLLSDEIPPEIPPNYSAPSAKINLPENTKNKRLAYTMRETAEILGISYISVHRLLKRG